MKIKYLIPVTMLMSVLTAHNDTASAQVSGTTLHVTLQDQKPLAEVNGTPAALEAPARIIDGSFYVPIRWVAQQFGMTTVWYAERRSVGLKTPRAYLEWNLERGTAASNGISVPLQDVALIHEGNLLVKLSWIAPYMNVQYIFRPHTGAVELTYLEPTDTAYRESVYNENKPPNSAPIAKFLTNKDVYRMGEPIVYTDISYDPDAEGLPEYEWVGQKDAFFVPGTYPVTLKVRDSSGLWSQPYTHHVKVTAEARMNEAEFSWYERPVGTLIKDNTDSWKQALAAAQPLSTEISPRGTRQRVVSGEEPVLQSLGLIDKQTVSGQVRLVSHHTLAMAKKADFVVAVHNPDPKSSKYVHITRDARVEPSLYHRNSARAALAHFLTQPVLDEYLEVKPGETVALDRFLLQPGQGFLHLKDIEVDGSVEVGFLALERHEQVRSLSAYTTQERKTTRSASRFEEIHLQAYTANLTTLAKWSLNAPTADSLGTLYSMKLTYPRPAALALRAKDGYVNGTLKVNGRLVELPHAGLTDQDGAFLIYRSNGLEAAAHIEWMAAPGSTAPVEFIYYPLEASKK